MPGIQGLCVAWGFKLVLQLVTPTFKVSSWIATWGGSDQSATGSYSLGMPLVEPRSSALEPWSRIRIGKQGRSFEL